MSLQEVGLTLSTVGEIIIAFLVITVHSYVAHEKKIDKYVINTITKERYLAIAAIALIISGYFIQIM